MRAIRACDFECIFCPAIRLKATSIMVWACNRPPTLTPAPGSWPQASMWSTPRGKLRQWQDGPASGSAFVREVFPWGGHYDYQVSAGWIAPFAHFDLPLGDAWTASFGGRYERVRYDYQTQLRPGRTRDDLSSCGFGGCRYSRPGDRTDSFGTFSPKVSLMWRPAPGRRAWLSLAHGFSHAPGYRAVPAPGRAGYGGVGPGATAGGGTGFVRAI